jgi:hypothetical protein
LSGDELYVLVAALQCHIAEQQRQIADLMIRNAAFSGEIERLTRYTKRYATLFPVEVCGQGEAPWEETRHWPFSLLCGPAAGPDC